MSLRVGYDHAGGGILPRAISTVDQPATQAGSKTLQVLEALRSVMDPATGQDIVALGLVKNLSIASSKVKFDLFAGDLAISDNELSARIHKLIGELPWVEAIEFHALAEKPPESYPSPSQAEAPSQHPAGGQDAPAPGMPQAKHVIAVGSGKGGVGKSTVSVNIALALMLRGARVGVLDADVYGPSVPLMLGASGQPMINAEQKILPIERSGLKLMSMGFLLQPDQAVVWRGPMIHGVVRQFLSDVDWGELDYLIVDLPPGTGDAPLSLIQALPLTAAIVVTTPQGVAASVAQKAMSMFERMGIRTLGVIENMSYFICPHCNKESDIFDRGGGWRLALAKGVAFLGEIPLDERMRQGGDTGQPVVLADPDSELALRFREIAANIAAQVEEGVAATP